MVTQGLVSGAALGPGWNLMEAEGFWGKVEVMAWIGPSWAQAAGG